MGPTRYRWWGFVKAIIRIYPQHKAELDDLRSQSITPGYGESAGHGSGVVRTAEQLAIRTLQPIEQREYEAVDKAIEHTLHAFPDGEDRIKLVDMIFWHRTDTLQEACQKLHISYATGKRWHNTFIKQVAINFGLID